MKNKLPVVAVIPAYNEQDRIGALLGQVLEREYDETYVLDDASTDVTLEVARLYGREVKLVSGKENVGSGANRNRIIPALGRRSLIHFLDADVTLNGETGPEIARDLMVGEEVGYIGGLIRNPEGQQLLWNYGPGFSLPQMASASLYTSLSKLATKHPETAKRLQYTARRFWPLMREWPDTNSTPISKQVYWSAEANMLVDSEVFSRVGGFDSRLRYHEAMELSLRMERLGLKRYFDPSLDVIHSDEDFMNKSATWEFWKGVGLIAREMGPTKFIQGKPLVVSN